MRDIVNVCWDRKKLLAGRQWEEHPLFIAAAAKPPQDQLCQFVIRLSRSVMRGVWLASSTHPSVAGTAEGLSFIPIDLKSADLYSLSSLVFDF